MEEPVRGLCGAIGESGVMVHSPLETAPTFCQQFLFWRSVLARMLKGDGDFYITRNIFYYLPIFFGGLAQFGTF